MTDEANQICRLTAAEMARAFSKGELSPVESARAALTRAEEINTRLNAFPVIDRRGAIAAARASEQRWRRSEPLSPIDGVTATIKDIVHCHGLDVRYGSTATDDISGLPDAPAVGRLRQAGAVILGLTTTPEFGWKAVTDNRKDGIARNPWNPDKTPGGSSGGAAIAAATGAGALHLGTDGGGSIRIPCAFTGLVGHKPTFGRVPAYPASPFGTVAHIGPIARTVEDVIAMLDVMSGSDIRDWTQPPTDFARISVAAADWSGKRIGYWKTPCVGAVDPQIEGAVERVLGDLAQAGAAVTEIRLPDQDALLEIFYRHWYVGAANRLSAVDRAHHDALDPGFLDAAAKGRRYSAVDHMQAQVQRALYGAKMDALLEEYDLLLSPTVAIPAFDAGSNVPVGSGCDSWVEWSSFSFPMNLSQQPACSVPCGKTVEGLPMGLQIIGARGADTAVLGAALAYQRMYPERFLTPGGHWPPI